MTAPLPSVFVSHGSPMLILEDRPERDFLISLGQRLPRPDAVLVVSAHWETDEPTVSVAERPQTIHDFFGFPDVLFAQRYPAPGAPEMAQRAAELLRDRGFEARTEVRGLDHGAWMPLKLAWPEADVPVAQLSIQPHMGPSHHFAIGQALAPLRSERVLLLATGSMTHNLGEWRRNRGSKTGLGWVAAFADWVEARLAERDLESLLDYRGRAPYAVENHPTDEHLLPFFVALGAGGAATVLHRSYLDGVIAMDAYAFA